MTKVVVPISEAVFTHKCIEFLQLKGWMVTHFRPCQRQSGKWATALSGSPGFPDLCAAKDGRVLFIELKSANGRLSPGQKVWAKHLPAEQYLLLRPDQFDELVKVVG